MSTMKRGERIAFDVGGAYGASSRIVLRMNRAGELQVRITEDTNPDQNVILYLTRDEWRRLVDAGETVWASDTETMQ